jgi:prophage DNA circulation protein
MGEITMTFDHDIEVEMRKALGLNTKVEETLAKSVSHFRKTAKETAITQGWYVRMSVRKIVKGSVSGITEIFECTVPTISRLIGEIEAKKIATKNNLKVWAILDSCPEDEKLNDEC